LLGAFPPRFGSITTRVDKPRDLINLLGDRNAFFDVLELYQTRVFGNDRTRVRIPTGQPGTGLDRLSIGNLQRRTVGNFVLLPLATVVVGDQDLAGTGDDDLLALGAGDVAHGRSEAHDARAVRLDLAGNGRARRCTTDVEGAHGQLRSRLADRLCSDHADRFADVDRRTTTEVAAITLGAQTVTRFAGQRRARLDFVDPQLIDQIAMILADQRPCSMTVSCVSGCTTSEAVTRPRIRSRRPR
jgi:hypothetical protein